MTDKNVNVLIVDDEPHIREILFRTLRAAGYCCATAANGEEAFDLVQNDTFHLVLADIMMPGMSGIELLRRIKEAFPDVAVIMATAVDDRATATEALKLGAYGYLIKPFDRNDVLISVENALERRRLSLLSQAYERQLEAEVEARTREVRHTARQVRLREEEIVFRLLSSMGWRDHETGAHARRIGLYSAAIAEEIGWDESSTGLIRLAAPMHDLGKIGISDRILCKPGKLDQDEFDRMKEHTIIGARILEASEVELLQMAGEIALSHHERWDGQGYPQRLPGYAIPESGRIVAVADVYDALVHNRVYKPAFPEEMAVAIMTAERGRHFDPRILDCFLRLLPEMRRIRETVKEE